LLGFFFLLACQPADPIEDKPNFLVLLSDNHYYSHLGCYGDPVVKTPNIDRIAKVGLRFTQAYCAAPSCTAARGALLAGQDIWRLREGANLHSTLPADIPTYTDLLEKVGYGVGHDRKGWGPGSVEAGGRTRNPAGYSYKDLAEFLSDSSVVDKPWSYWVSSRNPHRPFDLGAGIASGMDPTQVEVPPYLPDVPAVRSDICDYYLEIQNFDEEVGAALQLLEEKGMLENTVVIICGDNGWMMPRGLANLYDFGTRVPLIIAWPQHFQGDRVIDDFVSLNDLAPSILEIAGLDVPKEMNAHSLLPILASQASGKVEEGRDFMVTARERHALCREGGLGYPGRAIRTDDFLYIQNTFPDRWPAGDSPLFGDIDLHMLQQESPTKEYMMEFKDQPEVAELYRMAFLKRPEEELFDLSKDPFQLQNVAQESEYQEIKLRLQSRLQHYLVANGDP
ncbi:unnamed protein product, partial [Ectocarpus sp. 12 AP-2014]